MRFELLRSPVNFLKEMLGEIRHPELLQQYERWWEEEGQSISFITDRMGTPWLRMFDRFGKRVDEVLFSPDYWKMLKKGYRAGVVWRAFAENSLLSPYLLGYVTSFYDPGLYCPYTVSLATAVPLDKYGDAALKTRFLPPLLSKEDSVWQGATWMTEVKGGSDLGAAVETVARPAGAHWRLTGEKYFASNLGAELAVVAARPEGAPQTVRGLALFLLPKHREDGTPNYLVRRLKDKIGTRSVPTGEVELRESEAYLLGQPEWGIHLILEVLNLSRVANSVGSVALAQRALAEALGFAEERTAFGKRILEHPLLRKQFEDRVSGLQAAFALAWEAVERLDEVWREPRPSSDRYYLFRLVAHLAKYWTAETAAQTAKWAMEVHGGMGVLEEYGVDRWQREAMILSIWEGTAHRQILDALEVLERKRAHHLLAQHLASAATPQALQEMVSRVETLLALPPDEREAQAEELFRFLAVFTAGALRRKRSSSP
ncbi:MAG: acyl-CoA dehydrogenase family protein [Terriglobia bacterium]